MLVRCRWSIQRNSSRFSHAILDARITFTVTVRIGIPISSGDKDRDRHAQSARVALKNVM